MNIDKVKSAVKNLKSNNYTDKDIKTIVKFTEEYLTMIDEFKERLEEMYDR